MNEEILYKYSTWNKYTQDALSNRYFWFSKPIYFNDPFDCNMESLLAFDTSRSLFEKMEINSNNPFNGTYDYIKKEIDNTGILCLTSSTEPGCIGDKGFNNIHFWSHYADSHKGMALGFDMSKIETFYADKIYYQANLTPVKYREKPLDISNEDFILDDKDSNNTKTKRFEGIFKGEIDFKEIDAFIKHILISKDKRVWHLENEKRIILGSLANEHLNSIKPFGKVQFEIFDSKGYRIPYPEGDILNEVTFGAKFNQKEINCAICKIKDQHNNVKFYQAKLDFRNADINREEII